MVTGPTINRHRSKQDFETPQILIEAIEARYGKLFCDLAGTEENKKAPQVITPQQDSFSKPWSLIGLMGNRFHPLLFLNPEFGDIAPWAEKCALESAQGARILFLVPASVDSNWWKNYVHGKAWVDFLSPRVSFDNKNPFPKPMSICAYGICGIGYGPWRWKP